MAFPLTTVIGAAAAMAAVAFLLRRFGGGQPDPNAPDPTTLDGRPASESGPGAAAEAEADASAEDAEREFDEMLEVDEHEPDDSTVLAVTSGGGVFMPMGGDVRILPLGEAHAAIGSGQVRWEDVRDQIIATARRGGEGGGMPGVQLDAGDFTAGRVVRGAPDVDPWRLELLGRDGEYQAHPFETEEAAHVALTMLETQGIIQRPLDDEGEPIPVPAEQYEEARRIFEDTLEEMANMPDVSDIEEPRP